MTMDRELNPKHPRGSLIRAPRFRIGAVLALAIAAGFVAWLALHNRNSSSSQAKNTSAVAASVTQIKNVAASVHHPVFWLGPKAGYTYELTQTQSGKVYVRYLPLGVKVGAAKPYLTVGTYPFPGALAAVQREANAKGAVTVKLAHGGLAVLDAGYPKSVHLAYPSVDYQVEVFDPTPARAMQIVSSGQVAHVGSLHGSSNGSPGTGARAASFGDLKSLAKSLGHPIYWAGPKAGYTYELTQTSSGKVYIRYLPPGVKVGASAQYLTVGTYPFAGAFSSIKQVAKGNAADTIKLPGGGLGVVDGQYPKSIHLAYPGLNFQIEVYDPSPRVVRRIVASHSIVPVH